MKATNPTPSNLNETNRPVLLRMLGSPSRIAESAKPMQRVLTTCFVLFALCIFISTPSMAIGWFVTHSDVGDFAEWANSYAGLAKVVYPFTGDFNGDARTDVALFRLAPGWKTMPVAFANGDGSWHITNSDIGDFAGWLATPGVQAVTGDFAGDGLTDVALIRWEAGWKTIPVAFANGDGSWRISNSDVGDFAGWAATPGVYVLTGDFDGDTRTDVALIRRAGGGWKTMPVAFANGDGSWRITNSDVGDFAGWAATPGVYVLTGDFDGDTRTDVALIRREAGWKTMPVAFANGDGSWRITNSDIGDFADWARDDYKVHVLTGDFDDNRRTDVALIRKDGAWTTMPVAFANGDGSWRITNSDIGDFAKRANHLTEGGWEVTGHFNRDGRTDVAIIGGDNGMGTAPVAFSNGDGSWRITNEQGAVKAGSPYTGDFNRDGRTDVVLVPYWPDPGHTRKTMEVIFSFFP
jgi:FG-GAP-like repeat